MRHILIAATIAASTLAGCATPNDPARLAERECGNFARIEGARLVGVEGVDAVTQGDANYKVRMKVEDALSRRLNAECLYSSSTKTARWAAPLPKGFERI